jgi:hypothetical protein
MSTISSHRLVVAAAMVLTTWMTAFPLKAWLAPEQCIQPLKPLFAGDAAVSQQG